MALSDADAARLASLRTARDNLISGQAVSKITSGGRTVEYGPADLQRLNGDISALEAAEARNGTVRRRGPIRFAVR